MTFRSGARQAFVDTSAFFALLDARDQYHDEAVRIHRRLVEERYRLMATNFILAETHAILLSKLGRALALRFLEEMERSAITIVRVTPNDESEARTLLGNYDDKDFSLTDATSFVIMNRLGVSQAFTFDRDFAQYGMAISPP